MLNTLGPAQWDAGKECELVPWLDLQVNTVGSNVLVGPMLKPFSTELVWSYETHEPVLRVNDMIARWCQADATAVCIMIEVWS